MNRRTYLFLGTALQAFTVAGLQALNIITVTPLQQASAGTFFLVMAVITIMTGKRK